MAPPNGGQGDRGLASVRGDVLTTPLPTAAAGGGGLHATGHDPGDGPQLQSLQAEQAPDPEGSPHDGEAGEAAEDRAGAQAPAEAPGAALGAGRQPRTVGSRFLSAHAVCVCPCAS